MSSIAMVNHEFFLITTRDEACLKSSFNEDSMYDSSLPLKEPPKNQRLFLGGWCPCC